MSKVTRIESQKKDKSRVSVYLDGKFAFGLDLETAMKHGLKSGNELSEQEIERLLSEGEMAKWYNQALKLISRRPRSVKEIEDWLSRRQAGEAVRGHVIEKLFKVKMLDDEKFAKWWVDQRLEFRPKGERALWQELRSKGIDKSIISNVLEDLGDQTPTIRTLALKKKKQVQRDEPNKQKEKVIGFLLRKGYSWSDIKGVIDELWQETYT